VNSLPTLTSHVATPFQPAATHRRILPAAWHRGCGVLSARPWQDGRAYARRDREKGKYCPSFRLSSQKTHSLCSTTASLRRCSSAGRFKRGTCPSALRYAMSHQALRLVLSRYRSPRRLRASARTRTYLVSSSRRRTWLRSMRSTRARPAAARGIPSTQIRFGKILMQRDKGMIGFRLDRALDPTSQLHHAAIYTLVLLRQHPYRALRRNHALDSLFTSSRVIVGQPLLSG
jgi:hypothetical protein